MSQTEGGRYARIRELYTFIRTANTWRYTSDSRDVVAQGVTYEAVNIKRSDIELTTEIDRKSLTVTVDIDHPVAELFKAFSPADIVAVTVQRVREQWDETTGLVTGFDPPVAIWSGRILGARWNGISCDLFCEPGAASLRRTGLRRLFQRTCPLALYGSQCKAPHAPYAVTPQVLSKSGTTVNVSTVGGHPNGTYDGGYLLWETIYGYTELRMIISQVGTALKVSYPLQADVVLKTVTLYAGCNRTMDDCYDKHNNSENYGGQLYIPKINPFGSSPIF